MARRYKDVWEKLKRYKEVTIRCRPHNVDTIVQAVKKEKAMENAPRVALELPALGKLQIKRNVNKGEITFRLLSMETAENL